MTKEEIRLIEVKEFKCSENGENQNQTMKKYVYSFMDDDFGEVKMEYCPDTKNLVLMGSLIIRNTPVDWDWDMICYSWDTFKLHYCYYGLVEISYDQIPEMENIYNDVKGV